MFGVCVDGMYVQRKRANQAIGLCAIKGRRRLSAFSDDDGSGQHLDPVGRRGYHGLRRGRAHQWIAVERNGLVHDAASKVPRRELRIGMVAVRQRGSRGRWGR